MILRFEMKALKEIYDYREMIHSLVRKELRGRYKGSALGFLWTFINPLLQLLVYTLVFSVIMRAGIDQYYIFLFVALVPWMFFSSALTGGASCVITSQDMVKKIYFPREVLPIAYVNSSFVNIQKQFEAGQFVAAYYKADRVFSSIEPKHVEKVQLKSGYAIDETPRGIFENDTGTCCFL